MGILTRMTSSVTRMIMEGRSFSHFFFDLDNTLTRSKSPIRDDHARTLEALSSKASIVVVSGAKEDEIRKRIPFLEKGMYILAQNGNHAEYAGVTLWDRVLSEEQKRAISLCVSKMHRTLSLDVRDPSDLVVDRGCQIAYSLIGHHEDIQKKEQFDPDFKKRKDLLNTFKTELAVLQREVNVDVLLGGTTNLDFIEAGKNKGFNVKALIEHMGWDARSCVYFGDALFPGGNDETVRGVIDVQPVQNYEETFAILSALLEDESPHRQRS